MPHGAGDARRATIYVDEGAFSPAAFADVLAGIASAAANRFVVRVRSAEILEHLLQPPFDTLPIERLVPANIAVPDICARIIHFSLADNAGAPIDPLAGGSSDEIEAFGLMLSDAVLQPAEASGRALAEIARQLGKPLVELAAIGAPVALQIDAAAVAMLRRLAALDPAEAGGMRGFVRRSAGRVDTVITEAAAFVGKLAAERGRHASPPSSHLRKLVDALRPCRPWSTAEYFAPGDWPDKCPSHPVLHDGPVALSFAWLDRAALAGARQYRDLVWMIHLLAFFAVFAAAAGYLRGEEDWQWPVAEFVTLLLIGGLFAAMIRSRLQYRWTACRIGAEQLRIARMCLPLLVVPRILLSPDRSVRAEPRHDDAAHRPDEAAVALAEVKRVIREEGPSALRRGMTIVGAADWLRCIVADQRDYHRKNHDRLHAVERAIRRINVLIFAAVLLAVAAHLFGVHLPALLLLTAGGPALAAALHGAAGRLEIARRNDLSRAYAVKLDDVVQKLDAIIAAGSGAWSALRELVVGAADAMGSEADAWHATMLVEPVSLP
ncbi:hypothetical protein [Sphingomonas nostoxanthinifaciens]|uniref:hypothetical protein n=1 Tax=Sphingomonas nostoxanthinifaciens TaxID=2872652 RepID=UPI001CC1FE31|nr:hypothetical protein [Sphingomonas nostoxanthinifaciens]UAK24308.1 hypothetical protein K8P63_18650 [Sphingomonas nostoxanthinifaciens]